MAKSASKQSSSSKSKGSSKKTSSSGKSSTSSTIPVNRAWQDPLLERDQLVARNSSTTNPVGRWLTEPSWQEPFNTIAEVQASGSSSGYSSGQQGSGAAATYATSRTQQHR